jgi:hypothetical protein
LSFFLTRTIKNLFFSYEHSLRAIAKSKGRAGFAREAYK